MNAQPCRLVGKQTKGGAVGLGEAKARESPDHREHPLGGLVIYPMQVARACHKKFVVSLDRRLGALAAHCPAKPLRLAGSKACEGDRDLEHLVLEDDRAERLAKNRLERGVLVGDPVVGINAHALATLDVRVDRSSLDWTRADDRHLDCDVLEVLGTGASQRLHLRSALDLEDPGRIGVLDALIRGRSHTNRGRRGRRESC